MAPTRPSKPTKPSNKARKSTTPSKSKSKSKISRPPPKQQKTRPNLHNPSALKSKSKSNPQVKTKSKQSEDPALSTAPSKPKKHKYTDKQLNLPTLNAIVPANASATAPANLASRGKKRKIFVDDAEGMATIMSLVQAEKEGDVEGKVQRMRRLEEIRENRIREAEKKEGPGRRQGEGKEKAQEREEVVRELKRRDREKGRRKQRMKGTVGDGMETVNAPVEGAAQAPGKKKKKVAFADV